MTVEAGPVPTAVPVTDLVMRARDGDQRAWDAIVERYAPLVWSICRRYRLADADADDAGQAVWLQLVGHIGQIRDPAALPGWLAATTGHECGRILRAARRTSPPGQLLDAGDIPDEQGAPPDDELLQAERHAALREALADLPPPGQQLIALLTQDPPLPYAQISARLGIPVGSIGPSLISPTCFGPTVPSSPGPTKIVCEDVLAPPGSVFGSDKKGLAREVARRPCSNGVGPEEAGTGAVGPLRLRRVGPRAPGENRPSRSRCLARLRRHPAIAALTNAEPASMTNELPGQAVMPTRSLLTHSRMPLRRQDNPLPVKSRIRRAAPARGRRTNLRHSA